MMCILCTLIAAVLPVLSYIFVSLTCNLLATTADALHSLLARCDQLTPLSAAGLARGWPVIN